jgi:hypothetical protein
MCEGVPAAVREAVAVFEAVAHFASVFLSELGPVSVPDSATLPDYLVAVVATEPVM